MADQVKRPGQPALAGEQSTSASRASASETELSLVRSKVESRASNAKLRLGAAVAGLGLGEIDYLSDTITLDTIAANLFALPANTPLRRGEVHARFHPEDVAVLAAKIAGVLDPAGNGLMDADHRILRPDRSVRWLSARKHVEFAEPDAGGPSRPTTGVLAVIDITERVVAQQSLRDSDQRMRLATEATGVGIWEWNIVTGEMRWDAQVFEIYGIPPTPDGRVDYSTWSNSLLPEDLPRSEEILQAMIRTRGRSTREFRILRKDDKLCRIIHAVETVRTNADGQAEWIVGTNLDITERRQNERALAASEAHRRTIFESSPDCVKVLSVDGRVEQVNNTGRSSLEIEDFDAVRGKRWSALWPEDSRYTVDTAVEEARAGRTAHFSGLCLTMKGTPKWWDVIVTPVLGPDGSPVNMIASSRDITDWKQTEDVLRKSEARFRATFENAAVGIAHVGPDGTWLEANERLCTIIGYSHDDIRSKTFQHITHPDDLKTDLDHVERLKSGASDAYAMEKRYIRKDGSVLWANLSVGCVRDDAGQVEYFVSVIEDISERKKTAQALLESAGRIARALEAGGLGAWELDFKTNIARGDERIRTMFGVQTSDIRQEEFLSLVHEDDRSMVQTALAQAANPGGDGHFHYEYRIRRPSDGVECWMNSQGQIVFDGKQPVRANGVTYDFTERKRIEQHVHLLMREVNHRSKNLLTVVQAIARQTARRSDPVDLVARLSERIDGLAASQDLLVKNDWQGVDVGELVAAQLSHFKELIGTRILLRGGAARLTAAAAQGVGMALHELATNAAKYGALSNATGRVTICWKIASQGTPEFAISWTEEGGPAVIEPTRSGFGQMVIGRMAESAISGSAEIDYRESGFYWKLTGPLEYTLETSSYDQNQIIS